MRIIAGISIGIIGFLILVVFIVSAFGFYPVAFSSKWIITGNQFNKIVDSSLFYYQKIYSVYSSSTVVADAAFGKELRRAALEQMIEDKIINEFLSEKIGKKELEKSVNDKISALNMSDGVVKGSRILYNLSIEDFKNLVLMPEARREILSNQGIDIAELKKSYKPVILLPGYYWQDGVLVKN